MEKVEELHEEDVAGACFARDDVGGSRTEQRHGRHGGVLSDARIPSSAAVGCKLHADDRYFGDELEDTTAFVDAGTRPLTERCNEKQVYDVIEVAVVEDRARAAPASPASLQSPGDRGEGGSRVEDGSRDDMGIPPEPVAFERQRQLQVAEADCESANVTAVFGENDEANRIDDDRYSTTMLVPHEACAKMPARETSSPTDETGSTRGEDGSHGGSVGFGSEPGALKIFFWDVQPSGGETSCLKGAIPPHDAEMDVGSGVPKTAVAHDDMSPANVSASNLNPSRASWWPASTATTSSESSPTGAGAGSPTLSASQHCPVGDKNVAEAAELTTTEKFNRDVLLGEVNRTSFCTLVIESASEEETAVEMAAPVVIENTDPVAPSGTPVHADKNCSKPLSSEVRATAADRPELPVDNGVDDMGEKSPTLELQGEAQQQSFTPEKEAIGMRTHLAVDTAAMPPGWHRPAVEQCGVDSGGGSVEGSFDTVGSPMLVDGTNGPFHEQYRPLVRHQMGSTSPLHYYHQPHCTPVWGGPPADFRPQYNNQHHGVPEGRAVYHPSLGRIPHRMVILPNHPPALHSGYSSPAPGQAVVRMAPYVVPGAGAGFDFAMQHDHARYGSFPGNHYYHADLQHHGGGIGVPVGFRPGLTEHRQLAGEAAHGGSLRGSSTGTMVENSAHSFSHMERTVSAPTPPIIARALGAGVIVGRASSSALANETPSTPATSRRFADSTVLSCGTQPSASSPITTALNSAHAPTNPPSTSATSMATSSGHAATASTADMDKGQAGGDLRTSAGICLSSDGAVAASSSEEALGSGASGVEGDSSRRNSAYNDIGLVVTRTKELEKILKDLFSATGSGLNEQLSSLRGAGSRIDRRTQSRIRSIAAVRNKLVHSVDANNLTISNTFGDSARRAFKIMVDDLEATLRESALRQPDESCFEEPARPLDAYTLGNHPAFWGMKGVIAGKAGEGAGGQDDEGVAAAARKREEEDDAVVVKDTARFPHNLITAKRLAPRNPAPLQPAPDVTDEAAFPAIAFASSAAVPKRQEHRGSSTAQGSAMGEGSGGASAGMASGSASFRGGAVGGEVEAVPKGWDGQGRIEEAQIISGRGVCRTLGQGEVGYVATTHTMSGVYRKWDHHARNPAGAWKNIAATKEQAQLESARRLVPGATSPAKGQVAFEGRGLDSKKPAKQQKQRMHGGVRDSESMGIFTSTDLAQRSQRKYQYKSGNGGRDDGEEGKWEEAVSARHRRSALREDRNPRHYGVRRQAAQPFWLLHGAQFGSSNCRGWFPTIQDWCARGIPECVYVPLEPSTEDRVAAMQFGHEPLRGLTLEEDEERLMRIAIRESAAESKRAYEKKYGTEAEREARREAQALARVKATAERESLERDEQQQLTEVIKASLAEKDDRNVTAAIGASKLEEISITLPEAEDPDILVALEESRRQYQAKQEMLQRQFGLSPQDSPPPSSALESTPNATTWNKRAEPARDARDQVPATPTWAPPPPAIPRPVESTPVHNAAPVVPTPPSPPLPRSPLSYNPAPASSLPAAVLAPPLTVQVNSGQERFPQPGISEAGSRVGIGDQKPELTSWPPTPAPIVPKGEGYGYHFAGTAPVVDGLVGHWHGPRASATAGAPSLQVGGVPAAPSHHTLQHPATPRRAMSLDQHTAESLTRQPPLQRRSMSFGARSTAMSDASRYICLQSVPSGAQTQVNGQGQGIGYVSHGQGPMVMRLGSGVGWARNNTTAPCPQAPFPTAVRAVQQSQDYPVAIDVANAIGVVGAMNAGQVPGVEGQHGHAVCRAGALASQQQPYVGSVQSEAQQGPRHRCSGDEGEVRSPGPRLAGWATGRIVVSTCISENGADSADEKSRAAEVAQAPPAMSSDVMPHAWGAEPSADEKELMQAMELTRLEELARQKNLSLVTDEDQELLRAMEESRAADLAREQEEMDAKAAMDMALKLSVDDIGGTHYGHNSSTLAQALADSSQSLVSPRTSAPLDSHLSLHTAASPPTDDTVMSAEVPVSEAVAGADITARNTATGASFAKQAGTNVDRDGRSRGMDGSVDSWVQQQRGVAAETPQAPMPFPTKCVDRQGRGEQTTPRKVGDEVQERLRHGMEEEKSCDDESHSPSAVSGDRTPNAPVSKTTSRDTLSRHRAWSAGSSELGGPMDDPSSGSDAVGGGGGGGGAGANAVDEELACVLEQSRVEAEQHEAARAAAMRARGRVESEEEMMARVIAESLREHEGSEVEQLEFQRAMEASLM